MVGFSSNQRVKSCLDVIWVVFFCQPYINLEVSAAPGNFSRSFPVILSGGESSVR